MVIEILKTLKTTHLIEVILIFGIILIQFNVAKRLWVKIRMLKDLNLHDIKVVKIKYPISLILDFDYNNFSQLIKETLNGEIIEESEKGKAKNKVTSLLLYSDSQHIKAAKIIQELNVYMLKNDQNLVNFNVVRDIVDRNYQVIDEDINMMLPTPLYLGLAATMLGIIFGLWGMISGETENLNNINSLIIGVGIAMSSSLIGLVLTTGFSTLVYKNSKKEAEEEKNEFYSMLQAFLLPELLRKGETGIEALNRRLENFSKVSADSVQKLATIAESSANTLESQIKLMARVDQLEIRKVSTTSLMIFDKLEQNLKSFEKFSAYWDRLNNSIASTSSLIDSLKELSRRFESLDTISSKIQTTLSDYNSTMSFFTQHIEEIKAGGNTAIRAVTNADVKFAEAIDELKKHMQERIGEIEKNGSNLDVRLSEIGSDVSKSLELATKEHLTKLSEAYSNHVPNFEKLVQLDNLAIINETIAQNHLTAKEHNSILIKSLIANAESTNSALRELNDGIKKNFNGVMATQKPISKSKREKIEFILRIIALGIVILSGGFFIAQQIFNLI